MFCRQYHQTGTPALKEPSIVEKTNLRHKKYILSVRVKAYHVIKDNFYFSQIKTLPGI
jgi:hypothetical protein